MPLRRFFRPLAAASLAAFAAGCAYVPFEAMYRLKSFDLGAFDPAALRVAIRISEVIERRGGAVVKVKITPRGKPEAETEHVLALEGVTEPGELAPLSSFAQAGERVHLYRLPAREVARVRTLQEEGRARHKAGEKVDVRIEAEPRACLARVLPPGPLHADLIARVAAGDPYFTVLRRVELRGELANRGVELATHLPPC